MRALVTATDLGPGSAHRIRTAPLAHFARRTACLRRIAIAFTTIAIATILHASRSRRQAAATRPMQTGGADHGIRLLHAERQPLRQQHARRRTSSSPTSPPRRSTPTSSACTRPGSASIISTRSACCPVPIWCSPTSPRAPSTSGSRRRSRCRRCTIRSASPSNGRRSIFSATAASISPPAAATTAANTRRSTSSFADNQSIFEEGMEVMQKLWAAEDRISHHGKHYQFDDVRITPKPMQKPLPAYIGSFSKPSIELAARLGCGLIVAPFAAAMSYGGLQAGRRSLQRDLRQARQQAGPADVQLLHALLRQRRSRRRRSAPARSATTRNA